MTDRLAKPLIVVGLVLVCVGVVLLFRDRIPFLRSLGSLPGDLSIKRENFEFHFPLMTSLILSVLVSFVLWVLGRWKA